MSTSNLSLSVEELLKLALDRYNDMKSEMEKAVNERECLKTEVKALRLKLIESDTSVEFYKTRVRAVIEQSASAEKPNPNRNPNRNPNPNFSPSSSKKRKRKLVRYCGKEEEEAEAGDLTNNSGVSKTQHSHYSRVVGVTYQLNRIISKIKACLTEENLKRFEESCFGHLLNNTELKFQGRLLFQLLLHMDTGASSKKRLVFNINNSRIYFGPKQFALITGLRVGAVKVTAKTTSSSSSAQNKILEGINPRMLLKNIDNDFLNVSRVVGKGKDELALKVALLHFLYGILFAGTRCMQIDRKYLDLIEDLHEFNAYPWGRVAFQFLASSMLNARKNLGCSRPWLRINGLTLALQVWAYEVMPSVAEYCAVGTNNPEDRIPRILHWSTPKKKAFLKDLEKFFTPGDEAHSVLHGIRASPWELEMLTTGTIPPKKGKAGDNKTNEHHVVRAEKQVHPLVERCSSSATGDVISDKYDGDDEDDGDGDDDNVVDEDNEDEADVASNSQSNDSDDDDISDGYMNNLVAGMTREMS